MLNIWVDADACPVAIKDILFRASKRTRTPLTMVSNHAINVPPSPYIKRLQVSKGFDVADNEIVERVKENDIVITSDIPLASEVIDKGGFVINFRGYEYNKDNIKAKLGMRDFMETLRASGVQTGGPAALNASDKQTFANALDRLLAKLNEH